MPQLKIQELPVGLKTILHANWSEADGGEVPVDTAIYLFIKHILDCEYVPLSSFHWVESEDYSQGLVGGRL